MDRMGCWISIPEGQFPATLLEKPREVGGRVLTHCGGPREQIVLSCDWPLTSSLSVYCSKLCFSGPPRLQEERQVCGWGGACNLQGLVDEGY